jgi:4-amino-4-deoxy-L-arabinose transferase-like glycosyltransferase
VTIDRLLSRRELAGWVASLLLVSGLLVLTQFASDDPDSALYAAISARLAQTPPAHWIAPEWWGNWDSEGLFHEHPVGVFLLPTALGAIGIPAAQAAYIVGIAAGLACLLIIGVLVSRVTSAADGRLVLILLQFMPVAFIFRIRANHEYPMLLALVALLVGLDAVRASWRHIWIVAIALTAALLVKGVFLVIPLVAAGYWILINPTRRPGSNARPILACVIGLLIMVAVAAVYDVQYERVTGETFWRAYWERQLGPLTLATPTGGGAALAHHLLFYAARILWHPAPWSLALLAACWARRGRVVRWWQGAPESARRGVLFTIAFALTAVAALSPASRFAERYVFSANYAIATLGAAVSLHAWPRWRAWIERLDARVPGLPVLTWLTLMLLRLTLGPLLPRISG